MSSRRQWLINSILAAIAPSALAAPAAAPATIPWRNWSGGQIAHPRSRFAPATEQDLAEFLRNTSESLRPVGAGHSFTPLVPTDGHLVVLDKLGGLLSADANTLTATFGAGTRLGNIGKALDAVGQAMFNLPDIDRQTLAGATATSTHGTGQSFTTLSGYITALRLISVDGEVHDVDATSDPELFDAARVSLGALGIITQITLQNRAAYRLEEQNWVQKTEEVLETFDEQVQAHRHFEMFPLTHSDYALVLAIDETDAPVQHPAESDDGSIGEAMAAVAALPPAERRPMLNAAATQIQPSRAVDASYKILANIRNGRFNEMEYSVPIEVGAACLREILDTIARDEIDVVFPLEYRYIKGDDLWLSMCEGGDRAAISIHRMAQADYRPYFDAIEPIFWKYGGRPHWGKVHSLSHAELTKLYPRFEDFRALRAELDPGGRLLNDHLKQVFGA